MHVLSFAARDKAFANRKKQGPVVQRIFSSKTVVCQRVGKIFKQSNMLTLFAENIDFYSFAVLSSSYFRKNGLFIVFVYTLIRSKLKCLVNVVSFTIEGQIILLRW